MKLAVLVNAVTDDDDDDDGCVGAMQSVLVNL